MGLPKYGKTLLFPSNKKNCFVFVILKFIVKVCCFVNCSQKAVIVIFLIVKFKTLSSKAS